MKAVIVDDEPPAIRELRRLLESHSDVQVVGEATGLVAARGALLRTEPHVLFLDVTLGRDSGFDLLGDVGLDTAVVFVTAHDHFAVAAFAARALDYLLKPVSEMRLHDTLERVRSRLARAAPDDAHRGSDVFTPRAWTFVPDPSHPELVRVLDIACISAVADGSLLHVAGIPPRKVARTLEGWSQALPSDDFVRVSRSHIVNLHHVARAEAWSNYSFRLHLRGIAEPVVMSRRRAIALRDLLP